MKRWILGWMALVALLALAESNVPWPGDDWPRAELEEQGLDPKPLQELVRWIRAGERFPDLHSLLIVRHGHLVLEEYFHGWDADNLHTLQSVTKSFTSALVGIAIEQGAIRGVEEKVLDFFPEAKGIENLDDRKRAMRLEDLLTMRSGTDYHEGPSGSPHDQLNRLPRGWDRFYLNRPMVQPPGKQFQYDSGGVILTSSMLKNRTGMHADAFAERHLFEPLGISRKRWIRNREGHPHTGGGLDLLPRDMARFGLLYLRGGRWGDRQVVPADWVARSIRRQVKWGRDDGVVGYGYLWWILAPDPEGTGKQDVYAAMGFRGQYIFVVPEHDMVVVVTGGTRNRQDQSRPIEFFYSHILPAVMR
ncbi:MAG: serine hydrolase [bacterium]|nr:serine hydrolase [bacterium]